jgi:hypothetical protein
MFLSSIPQMCSPSRPQSALPGQAQAQAATTAASSLGRRQALKRPLVGCSLLVLLALQTACGYHAVRGIPRLGSSRSLQVVPFEETSSVGLSAPMAQILCGLLAADGYRLRLTPSPGGARLEGTLDVSTAPSASRAGIASFQLAAVIQVRLLDADGALLVGGTVTAQEDFLPQPEPDIQPLYTERNRRFALARLAERAARAVHRLLQDAS